MVRGTIDGVDRRFGAIDGLERGVHEIRRRVDAGVSVGLRIGAPIVSRVGVPT